MRVWYWFWRTLCFKHSAECLCVFLNNNLTEEWKIDHLFVCVCVSGPQCVNWGVYERKAVRVYEGEAGRIHCPLFSHPKLYNYAQIQSTGHTLLWYKHTQELEEPVDLSLPKFVKQRDALWIQPASMQDTGEYICILRYTHSNKYLTCYSLFLWIVQLV